VAYATIATGGACVFGVGALTAQGIAGALAGLFAHGLAAAMLLGVAGALERRLRTCDLARLGGLAEEAPVLACLTGLGLALSLGVPLLAGFWGPLLVLLGTFAHHPALAAVMAAALVASAAAHLRVGRMMLLGKADLAQRGSSPLGPLGRRMPDALPGELGILVPLALLALLLGVWPGPLLSSMAAGVHDAGAAVEPAQVGE
jgi:NADH-quinone oxidoreductase subunit M